MKNESVKLYYNELNSGSNDAVEYECEDLFVQVSEKSFARSGNEHVVTSTIYEIVGERVKNDRVYLLSAAIESEDGRSEDVEVFVTADTAMLMELTESLTGSRDWCRYHLQEYPTFAAAYEVAGYILEGHPLAS